MTQRKNIRNPSSMTNIKSTYEHKTFTRQEWKDRVLDSSLPFDLNGSLIGTRDNQALYYGAPAHAQPCVEPSIPILLLNYFVVMAYEDSSVRMARELGFIKSNKDAEELNRIYKIRERAQIRELIKKGDVSKAMEEINSQFGVEVLENLTPDAKSKKKSNDEDLHFKLLLLNLIEMIRKHHQTASTGKDSNKFILELIEYSQDKLALKAGSNKEYMKELELVMTLLLFPMEAPRNSTGDKIKLPKSLKNLYSLSLRSKIADLVNRKLLQSMHLQILSENNNGKFPDLIGQNIAQKDFSNYNGLLRARAKEDIATSFATDRLAEMQDAPAGPLGFNSWSEGNWSNTTALLKDQDSRLEDESECTADYSGGATTGLRYEAKLIQVMKLWAWCENQLHNCDIGVPRVEGGI